MKKVFFSLMAGLAMTAMVACNCNKTNDADAATTDAEAAVTEAVEGCQHHCAQEGDTASCCQAKAECNGDQAQCPNKNEGGCCQRQAADEAK